MLIILTLTIVTLTIVTLTIVTLTISARTGSRNDRIGNVLIEPILYDVEDCEVVRAQHVHVARAVELAFERGVIQDR